MNAHKKDHKPENGKLALMLCVIAAFFFAAVIVKRLWFM
jgi:hypothetical protein